MSAPFEIGVDEAGYGPILGPLAVCGVRCRGTAEAVAGTVRRLRDGGLAIDDSKRVLQGARGLARLETAALVALGLARGNLPSCVRDVCGSAPLGAPDHPWYAPWDAPVPRWATAEELTAAFERAREIVGPGTPLSVELALLLEGEFNRRVLRTGNKAALHLEVVADVMLRLVRDRDGPGNITCDRLGGRTDYHGFLAGMFPFMQIATDCRTPAESRYRVFRAGGVTGVRFLVDGETHAPLVAWSSCIAKYAREVLMDGLNRTFAGRYAGLKATAGYAVDGERFLTDLAALAGAEAGWEPRLRRLR